MNKKITDYVIDLVEVLNKTTEIKYFGDFLILPVMVLSIIVSYILFYGLINPAR